MVADAAQNPSPVHHPIGVVARRTGLKPDLIRAWERRYGAVEPRRTGTNRRHYTDADIERLRLLRDAVRGGHGIGQIAGLDDAELVTLIAADAAARAAPTAPALNPQPASGARAAGEGEVARSLLEAAVAAVRRLDGRELERILQRSSLALSQVRVAEEIVVPLMTRIGDLWREGTLRPAHEHLASAAVRTFIATLRAPASEAAAAPEIVVTTPAQQRHELGALLVAAAAASEGWKVTYLGPDLPAEEIAAAARHTGARAVALSLTYPPDDPALPGELLRLRQGLGPTVELLVGGRAAGGYREVLERVSAHTLDRVADLRRLLEALREGPSHRTAAESSISS